ncbi:IS66 family insertion sequence element accessory protein TnpA [Desulfobulbus propionicus]
MNLRSAKEKFWQEHIDGWQATGLSQQVYCKSNFLALASFGYWRRKLQVIEP